MGIINKKYILIIVLVIIASSAVAARIYFRKSSTIAPGAIVGQPDNDNRAALEQLAALEASKTVTPIIVIPAISSTGSIKVNQLPKSVSDLILPDATGTEVSKVNYTDGTIGYKIQFVIKMESGAVAVYYFNTIQNLGWKIVTSLKSSKAALMDLDNAGIKAHVTFLQTGDTETNVRILTVPK